MYKALIPLVLLVMRWTAVCAQDEDGSEDEVPSTHEPHLMSTSVSVDATAGEAVTFPCDVDDLGDFVLLWKRENNRILFAGDMRIIRDDRITVEGSSLHVAAVQPKDSGEYTCQISTNPPTELSHTLDVLYPPTVRPRPKDAFITAKEGERVTLTCEAKGNPVPTITWRHAGHTYDSSEESSYIIISAQKNDSGEYECIADNMIGDPASAVITVEIVSAPKVFTEPSEGVLVVKEGEPISIGCRATGDPMPVIMWKKPNGDRLMTMNDENKIMIAESSRNDAGTYECIANNSLGISTMVPIRVQVLYAPVVQLSHERIHAREGSSINLTCIVKGEPAPTVTWRKDKDQEVHNSDHYHLRVHNHAHILYIRHLQEQEFGRYECSASNSMSSASASVLLIGTPQVPTITSKPHSAQDTRYTITWTVQSHTPVDKYSLMYRKKSDQGEWEIKSVSVTPGDDEEMHTQMFQLVELQPATEYEAVVKAHNKFGWSEQSEALVFTTKSEDKQMESITSNSFRFTFSLNLLFLLIVCSLYSH